MRPGANVSAVARAHDVSLQQVFAWRRKAILSGAITLLPERPLAEAQSFAKLEVAPGDDDRGDGLEIVIGDATIRVSSGVTPSLLVEARCANASQRSRASAQRRRLRLSPPSATGPSSRTAVTLPPGSASFHDNSPAEIEPC
jgi:transposase